MSDAPQAQPADPPSGQNTRQAAEAEQRVLGQLRLALPLVAILATTVAGALLGPGPAVLVLAGFALLAAIESLWSSLQALLGEAPLSREDAYAYGAPSAEEEQKRAVLRALKDLEFERGVGKISDDDFAELTARYRAEAKRLLQVIDERGRPGREKVEKLVDQLLKEQGLDPTHGPANDTKSEAEAESESESEAESDAESEAESESESESDARAQPCPHCQTANDDDAVFCKKCGARLDPNEAKE